MSGKEWVRPGRTASGRSRMVPGPVYRGLGTEPGGGLRRIFSGSPQLVTRGFGVWGLGLDPSGRLGLEPFSDTGFFVRVGGYNHGPVSTLLVGTSKSHYFPRLRVPIESPNFGPDVSSDSTKRILVIYGSTSGESSVEVNGS